MVRFLFNLVCTYIILLACQGQHQYSMGKACMCPSKSIWEQYITTAPPIELGSFQCSTFNSIWYDLHSSELDTFTGSIQIDLVVFRGWIYNWSLFVEKNASPSRWASKKTTKNPCKHNDFWCFNKEIQPKIEAAGLWIYCSSRHQSGCMGFLVGWVYRWG